MQTGPFALITGASSAIGMAVATQLAPARQLILHGRNREKLISLREALKNSESHLLWEQDLRLTEEIAGSLECLLGQGALTVDALVHCAGALQLGAFRLTDPRTELELFSVNVLSAMEIVRVLRSNNRRALTDVVLISSGASLFGEKGNATYTATKGALDAFMKSLAIELSPHVRVNSILPGMIEGGMSDTTRQDASYAEVIRANYPLGLGRASDITTAVEFLLSEKSRWITGQQMLVDGGFSAHCNHAI